MKKSFALSIVAIFMALDVGCTSTPQKKPKVVGFAIVYPLQYPSKSVPIEANRTSILWGKNDYVRGMDFGGIGNFTEKEFDGSALSLVFNDTRGKAHIFALQLGVVANLNHGHTKVEGFQVAGGLNYSGDDQSVYGVQVAALNIGMKNKIYGFQVGAYNEAEAVYGFQIGVINRTKNLYGIQIGALNFSGNNGLPLSPVLNIGF